MLISTALLLDSNIRNSVCTPAKLPWPRVVEGWYYTAWSTMTESVGNKTIENTGDFCLVIGTDHALTTHWPDFLTWDDIKNILGYAGYVSTITKLNLRG
jgi:hypothetical protein